MPSWRRSSTRVVQRPRAAVISELVQEMCATVEWLHHSGPEPDDSQADELTSIMRLSRAVQDHQRRMNAFGHLGALKRMSARPCG